MHSKMLVENLGAAVVIILVFLVAILIGMLVIAAILAMWGVIGSLINWLWGSTDVNNLDLCCGILGGLISGH